MNNNYPPNPNGQEQPPQPPFGQPQPPQGRPPLVGLGGWLVVFQIYMYWSLLVALLAIPTYIFMMFLVANPDVFPAEVRGDIDRILALYNGNLQALSVYEMIVAVIQIVLLVIMLVQLYTRKRSFPRTARAYLLINLALTVIAFFIVPPTSGMVTGMIISAIMTLLWNLYFSRSVRIKNTFVR
ncbi:DUF2569 family protein [Paenibacillus hunanensis]|uniref:DUF2569 family protein n=1 Tax=Paenibacillus hunanensis TaxID=539262 RepID=UPI002A6B6938|nr:DUF2569 family protein [Paenibacillus hunanensis]WPP42591.1 DUF2569 family protein [Paenibacillus hunanensis]